MGFLDFFRPKENNNLLEESVRITNNDGEIGLHYNPAKMINEIISDEENILNSTELNNFRLLKTDRNTRFRSFDIMAQDSRISSILNMYADDSTQYNQAGSVIWAESADDDVAAFANRLIEGLQINKHAWNHIYSLCKYGDLYLELFYDDEKDGIDRNIINDETIYNISRGARLTEYVEAIKNPAQIFDLVHRGKTAFYVKSINTNDDIDINRQTSINQQYQQQINDIILPAEKFIHMCINEAYTRFPNKYILKNTETDEEIEYDVREGNSVLANQFKTWTELNLLEDSVILNRLSKSAIVRLIQIEVGNTDDDEIKKLLIGLRDKISRSRYLDKNTGDYNNQINPGPLENTIYHATHDGKGVISHSVMGGDVDVKALADVDHSLEKLAQGFATPLAYIKESNSDGGGLSAGTSLTKFDAKYGRTLKRYQNAYIMGITDLINVFAYKRGRTEYINSFTIKMVSPSAVEENERDEKIKVRTEMIQSIMQLIQSEDDSYTKETRKETLNYLIKSLLQDTGLNDILTGDSNTTLINTTEDESSENTEETDY